MANSAPGRVELITDEPIVIEGLALRRFIVYDDVELRKDIIASTRLSGRPFELKMHFAERSVYAFYVSELQALSIPSVIMATKTFLWTQSAIRRRLDLLPYHELRHTRSRETDQVKDVDVFKYCAYNAALPLYMQYLHGTELTAKQRFRLVYNALHTDPPIPPCPVFPLTEEIELKSNESAPLLVVEDVQYISFAHTTSKFNNDPAQWPRLSIPAFDDERFIALQRRLETHANDAKSALAITKHALTEDAVLMLREYCVTKFKGGETVTPSIANVITFMTLALSGRSVAGSFDLDFAMVNLTDKIITRTILPKIERILREISPSLQSTNSDMEF